MKIPNLSTLKNITKWIINKLLSKFSQSVKYWDSRYIKHGKNAELNLTSDVHVASRIFIQQTRIVEAIFKNKEAQKVLDFGCGTGRFSTFIADINQCSVVAYDFCAAVTLFQKSYSGVLYTNNYEDVVYEKLYDTIFISLVLGAMTDKDAKETLLRLSELLSQDGSFIIMENTSQLPSSSWKFRSLDQYSSFLPTFSFKVYDKYFDNKEEISAFTFTR